ncbi:MAG: ABC transporter permease [Defluviitaleaceae bacterium]|nr:ABC transporter permease [Defluviitaleaceae bacterium]
MTNLIDDTKTMFWRSALTTLRNPTTVIMSLVVPAILMLVFVNVFGGSMDVGGMNFANFIVPGILVNVLIQSSISTGIGVNQDMNTGVINRFRSMDIASSAFLTGHVLVAFLKAILTTSVALGVAYIAGFRPVASLTQWLLIAALIALFILAVTWLAVMMGVTMASPEDVSGILTMASLMAFLSPGMAPTENMPRFLRIFAENQPMGPFVNSIRALTNGYSTQGNDLLLTLIWWGGILVVTFAMSVAVYRKKLTA